MFEVQFSPWNLATNISATLGAIILVYSFHFCWNQWRLLRKYSYLPSRRLEAEFLLRVVLGRYPKGVPFTSFVFQVLLKAADEFRGDGLCVLWFLKPNLFVFNEKIIKNLMNEVNFADKGVAFNVNKLIFGNGLLASNHELWKVHRKLLSPAFSVGVLRSKVHDLNKYAVQLADGLGALVSKPGDDVWNLIKYSVCQNMTDFVLGFDLTNEKHASMAENFLKIVDEAEKVVIERICRPWMHRTFLLPLFPSGRKYLKIAREVHRQVQGVMDELMKIHAASETEHQKVEDTPVSSSLMDSLLKLYLRGHHFTEQDVRDQIVTFTSAGYETVSVAMLWCFYTLGHHPEVQEKAYNELQSVAPEGDLTYEDLAKMKYLECVIKETMRLYPTVPLFERKAITDIQLEQYTIPKGTAVGVFVFLLHRDPNVFPEPEKFDPERFWDRSQLRPWMYVPFSEGYRNCIGKKFAMIQMKLQLAHVIRRFRITSLNKIDDTELDWTTTLKPTKSLRFSFENRLSKD